MMFVLVWYSRRYYPERHRPRRRRRSRRSGQADRRGAAERAAAARDLLDHRADLPGLHDPHLHAHAGRGAGGDRHRRHPVRAGLLLPQGTQADARGAPARRARHPGEGHRMADPGLLPLPVHPGRRRRGDRPDREPGPRAGVDHRRHLQRARPVAQGDLAGRGAADPVGLGLPVGGDRQHPLHRRHHPAGGEPARQAQCRPRRPGPVVGAGARRLPRRQRHADRRLGQRHGHGAGGKGRQAHLVQRVHRLRLARRRDHAR